MRHIAEDQALVVQDGPFENLIGEIMHVTDYETTLRFYLGGAYLIKIFLNDDIATSGDLQEINATGFVYQKKKKKRLTIEQQVLSLTSMETELNPEVDMQILTADVSIEGLLDGFDEIGRFVSGTRFIQVPILVMVKESFAYLNNLYGEPFEEFKQNQKWILGSTSPHIAKAKPGLTLTTMVYDAAHFGFLSTEDTIYTEAFKQGLIEPINIYFQHFPGNSDYVAVPLVSARRDRSINRWDFKTNETNNNDN